MKTAFTSISLFALCLLAGLPARAQQQTPLDIALRYLEQQRDQWQLTEADVKDVVVSDQYTDSHNGVTHLYFIQRHAGIELYNAINGVHVSQDGRVIYATNRFSPALANRVNTTTPSLTPLQAIEAAASHLGLAMDALPRLLEQPNDKLFIYDGGKVSDSDIHVKLRYQLVDGGMARLVWDLAIDMPTNADFWSLRVDALTGEVLDQQNWTLYCDFGSGHDHEEGCGIAERQSQSFRPVQEALAMESRSVLDDGAQYNVFPSPVESPNHGDRELVVNPADPIASPYGWHDINGQDGPEYRITRGNNVHAFLDLNNSNSSSGDEPNGGDALVFDFPLDLSQEPSGYRNAAVTQLFYFNNFMHDFAYAYGFTAQAGNFQQNNYGSGGSGGDYVLAQAQDGGGSNNANFSTPPDGFNGQMQMFLWTGGGSIFKVNSPQSVAGFYEAIAADFGPPITSTPLTGEVIIVNDGTLSTASQGCNALNNGDELQGKIALIDRGSCNFDQKIYNAQNAGAIGAIVCNFEDALLIMGAVNLGGQINIPSLFIQKTDCDAIRVYAGQGLSVTFQIPENNGPTAIDGDLDNGIVGHEYTHGISIRLTGGPSNSGCLNNDEQMGEGWSDFFALVATVKPGDVGETARGIGTYALRQETTGPGFRRRRYSTDMSIDDQVLSDIACGGLPHCLGEVWATTLWDLYWAMVDEYGFDEDQVHGNGGNNKAILLVMDAMKMQACSPGFIDGRDAILAADQANFGGANECLIWQVFARRGIGYYAEQGSSNNVSDNIQNFDPRPECIKELKITKAVTPFINPGEEVAASLTITNHKGNAVSGVMVEDELPAGATYVAGSGSGAPVEVQGDKVVFNLGDMSNGEVRSLSYKYVSDAGAGSYRQYLDDVENGDENWFFLNLFPEGFDIWYVTDEDAHSGTHSWYVPNTANENDQVIQMVEPIAVSGSRPVLRFYHRYNTQAGYDGGFVEITTNGGASWDKISDKIIRNGYSGRINYSTFAIPYLDAYWGDSQGWIGTYVDLSSYVGQEVTLRFRFGSDDNTAPSSPAAGWYVDDIEFMDMLNYNGEACVTSSEGDLACAVADEAGTIVESGLVSSSRDETTAARISVFPNPAQNQLNVGITLEHAQTVVASLVSSEGRIVATQKVDASAGFQLIQMDVAQLPAGFYFVKVFAGQQTAVEKVIIK
ncbi:MAG: T9SS-dependent M36 family metallopeptidase [Lewinellaceae bacterium]|nr:T9SS-dependent M36 family metallopeptidase [Lewinellaceae bacterium]